MLTKKNRILLLASLIGMFFSFANMTLVSAHGPSSVSLEFNEETNQLTVSITHSVTNQNSHYIYQVKLDKNDAELMTQTYTSQPTMNSFSYTYSVTAETGDVLKATATCNQGGSKTGSLTISSGTITTETG